MQRTLGQMTFRTLRQLEKIATYVRTYNRCGVGGDADEDGYIRTPMSEDEGGAGVLYGDIQWTNMMAMVMTAMVMEMITSMVLMMLVADVGRLMKVMLVRIAMLCAEVHVMVMPMMLMVQVRTLPMMPCAEDVGT